jgi:hypothetical protein
MIFSKVPLQMFQPNTLQWLQTKPDPLNNVLQPRRPNPSTSSLQDRPADHSVLVSTKGIEDLLKQSELSRRETIDP